MYSAGNLISILGKRETFGNIECICDGLNLCNRKTEHSSILSYATSSKYLNNVIENTAVRIMLVHKNDCTYNNTLSERDGCIIFTDDPEKDFYKIHETLCNRKDFYKQYDFESIIGNGCNIHPSAIIDSGVKIGNNVKIGALTVIKKGTMIENGVEIGCNSVIGSEGFQVIASSEDVPLHITHVGGVRICSDSYIGDCTCIGNSLFEGVTYIGQGVRIDNLVHVAHNLYIEENAVITAQVILCGSSVIKRGAWIAPNSSILNNVVIGEHATIGMGSVVIDNIPAYAVAYGSPARVKKMKNVKYN